MSSRIFIPLLLTGALALACGPRSHSESVAGASHASRVAEQSAARRAADRTRRARHDGELVPALAVTTADGAVRFALSVANAGNKTLELHFADGQTHDITVLDPAGRPVWRWAEGRMFTQAHRTEPIAGGDTLRVEEQLPDTALHGRYVAVATIRSTNYPIETKVAFDLP